MAEELLSFPMRFGRNQDVDNTVWNVLARATPDEDLVQIGRIEITDSFISSQWADDTLFFRHENFGDDLSHLDRLTRRQWRPFENDLPLWGEQTPDSLPLLMPSKGFDLMPSKRSSNGLDLLLSKESDLIFS